MPLGKDLSPTPLRHNRLHMHVNRCAGGAWSHVHQVALTAIGRSTSALHTVVSCIRLSVHIHIVCAGGELSQLDRVAVAAVAGGTSALVSTPAELLMIQQQRTGDSLAGAARRVISTYGLKGLYRGFVRPPLSRTIAATLTGGKFSRFCDSRSAMNCRYHAQHAQHSAAQTSLLQLSWFVSPLHGA